MFKTTDFVQVLHHQILENGEPASYWRNALFVQSVGTVYTVIYTDGTKQDIYHPTEIRKAEKCT